MMIVKVYEARQGQTSEWLICAGGHDGVSYTALVSRGENRRKSTVIISNSGG